VPSSSPNERAFYETEYHFDDDVETPGEARLRRALDLLEPMDGTSFLDLGSGVGWGAHLARGAGADPAVGLDFARRALMLGNAHIPEVLRVQADGCHLPLRDNSVERLLSFGSLEHFPDPDHALREVARILTASGKAVLVVPNFYVRTEQPVELRLPYGAWKQRFAAAGLVVTAVRADRGPAILKNRRPARMLIRTAAKVLAYVPRLPYQFIFRVENPR
jgi:SAM-dependent methyltransferase